jgi:thiol-disulfide isomerase/thioredoxin
MSRSALLVVSACLLASGCVPRLTSPADTDTGPVGSWEAPVNTWPVAAPPADLVGEGFTAGDLVPDFRLVDQFGDEVSLWQFYGDVIVLDISTMWCSPCRDLAETTAETQEDYEAEGFMYLTILPENVEGENPTPEDVVAWVETFEIASPVVADPDKGYTAGAVPDGTYPVVLVIDRDMRVYADIAPPTDAVLRDTVEEIL